MWKVSPLALVLWGLLPNPVSSVEIKNVRSTYGPVAVDRAGNQPTLGGALRTDKKIMAGDFIYLMFDIDGLKVDSKTGQAKYELSYALVDKNGKVVVKGETTPLEVRLPLGGTSVPGVASFVIGPEQAPGAYKVKLSVKDRNTKEVKALEYPFEIIASAFGIGAIFAPSYGVPGQYYMTKFIIAKSALDPKDKTPKVEIKMRVLDEAGKDLGTPILKRYPKELPDGLDLQKNNFVPEYFQVYLNRPGRFTIALDAEDKIGNRKASVRIPLTVLDVAKFGVESK